MRQTVVRLAYGAAAIALSFALAACGGGDDVLQLESVAEAATRTLDAGSSRIDFTVTMEIEGDEVEFEGEGVFDYRTGRGRFTMEFPDDLGVGAPDRLEMIADGLVLYMSFPGVDEALPGGKEWLKIDVVKMSKRLGLDFGQFDQFQQSPADSLQALRAADIEPERIGTDEVRGVPTTRYRAEFDLRQGLKARLDGVSKAERERMRASLERLIRMTGASKIPIEIWVDDRGIIRREVMTISMRQRGETFEMTTTSDFYDFGIEVDVEPPPARDVVDALELLSADELRRAAGG